MSLITNFPDLPDTAVTIAPIQDYRAQLIGDEHLCLESMAEQRQIEFSSGRYCLHQCQNLLDLKPAAILRKSRHPIWPTKNYIGSISHCDIAAAAIISSQNRSIGLDIERTSRVGVKVLDTLFTAKEKQAFELLANKSNEYLPGIAFSAKESGYKAIYPIGGEFIGFQEAEIRLDLQTNTFYIDYLGEYPPNRALNSGHGYWQVQGEYVLTIFVIN
jgi:4'-phosphopantetheinyl transferase EntD